MKMIVTFMKNPSNHLFKLISSMTAAEKRYLKRHYASSSSHLTTLFDYINKMEKYNEEHVKFRFLASKASIAKNLKVYKVQLNDLILKSLVSYHAKRNIRSNVLQGLEEVDILMKKELNNIAFSKLDKLIRLCEKEKDNTLLYMVLNVKLNFCTLYNLEENVQKIYTKFDVLFNDLSRSDQLRKLIVELKHKRKTKRLVSEEEILFYQDLLSSYSFNKKDSSKDGYLKAKIEADIHGVILNDLGREFELKQNILEQFEQNFYHFEYHSYDHWDTLYDLADLSEQMNKEASFKEVIVKLKELTETKRELKIKNSRIDYLELKFYFRHRRYGLLKTKVDTFIAANKEAKDSKEVDGLIYAFLYCKIFNEGQNGKDIFRTLQQAEVGTDLSNFIAILELIDHFESGSSGVIKYLLTGYDRKLKRSNSIPQFMVLFIPFLKKMIKQPPYDRTELVEEFERDISLLAEDGIYELWQEYQLSDWLLSLKNQHSYAKERRKRKEDHQLIKQTVGSQSDHLKTLKQR